MWSDRVWNKSESCQNKGISRVLDKLEGDIRYQNLPLNVLSALVQLYVKFGPIRSREIVDMWSERVWNKSENDQNISISRDLDKLKCCISYQKLFLNPLSALI